MIAGTHLILFADDAAAARAFFRDVLELDNVDAHGGWLIFALPPAELGIHPVERQDHTSGKLELWLMCRDLPATMKELGTKGVEFGDVSEESFGSSAPFEIPGVGRAWLYTPAHKSPLAEFSD